MSLRNTIATLSVTAAINVAPASDAMHVPILCKHWRESHAVAGALVGLGVTSFLEHQTSIGPVGRTLVGIGSALVLGYAKEALIDKHARYKEVTPWGIGAAAACISFEFRW